MDNPSVARVKKVIPKIRQQFLFEKQQQNKLRTQYFDNKFYRFPIESA